ncbi:UNC-like C-terminal-domain-containing protein [Lyophyllum atratum]|nr:UNC-like C-terminal-domain-containing protein [Lyophyllum atratum]
MLPLQLLPVALAAFVWASPVFASPPTSSNDPFKAIAAQIPRKPDLPVCCLKPLQPLEPLEDEVLLSFEEWKQKQSVQQEKERAKEREAVNRSTPNINGKVSGDGGNGNNTTIVSQDILGTGEVADVDDMSKSPKMEAPPPQVKVPIIDRYNYASLECSARVQLSHRSAKSTSSILSSKRDRYMLSPCNSPKKEKQFVVVELCEDIRIDTVQLANFEFFSGIFKDFRISVAKTEITREEAWTDAGTYRAKNVRGVQSFHPPDSLRDFYRYIRIEFLSHYGNEYYCPVSLLRVYGLTHLEQWKRDTWEQESREKLETTVNDSVHPPLTPAEAVVEQPIPGDAPEILTESHGPTTIASSANLSSTGHAPADSDATESPMAIPIDTKDATPTSISPLSDSPRSPVSIQSPAELAILSKTPETKPIASPLSVLADNQTHDSLRTTRSVPVSSSSAVPPSATDISSTAQQSNVSSTQVATHKSHPSGAISLNGSSSSIPKAAATNGSQTTTIVKAATTTITTSIAPSVVVSVSAAPSPHVTTGGESIYRTIMNRLTALEGNHTLYARYVEQQTSGVREVLRRVAEDVGRLEGIGRAQSQTYQRTVRDWEKRQQQLQMDYGELMARVEYLSDEIVLEKRLGIAQLCLLLAVLVFMGLTRGSRGDQQPVQLNRSMREWGKRHLSFSGEWTSRFTRRGRSGSDGRDVLKPHPQAARPLPVNLDHDNVKVAFPSTERAQEKMPLKAMSINTRSISSDARVQPWPNPRSRTPSMRSGARQHQHVPRPPSTPTPSHRPRLQRSNSQGLGAGSGPVVPGSTHKSARKWARTAHLHEVRNGDGDAKRRRARGERENEVVDVFATGPFWARRENMKEEKERDGSDGVMVDGLWSPRKGDERGERRSRPVTFKPPEESEIDQWVDTDTDFEEGEGDWDFKPETGTGGPPMAFSAAGNEH